MKDILDRLIGAGKQNTIEGALILTILFGDKIPGEIVNEIVVVAGSLLAIYKFYAKKNS